MPDHTPLPVTAEITKRAARLETKPVSGMSWDTCGVMNDEDDGMVDDNLVGPADVDVDSGSASLESFTKALLCPPKELVECMFPDSFVFPTSLWPDSQSSLSKPSLAELFKQLCNDGLYSSGKWTAADPGRPDLVCAKAPDLLSYHTPQTELEFVLFLNTIVDHTVKLVGGDINRARLWSASSAGKSLPGSFENRKPDGYAIDRQHVTHDWRALDCILELKNGSDSDDENQKKDARRDKKKGTRERKSFEQIADRAQTIFDVQDDRRFVIVIRILRDKFSFTVFDRGGSIWAPLFNVHDHPQLFYRLILGISLAERRHIGYDTSVTGSGTSRRVRLDLGTPQQGLRDLELQLVLHMTGRLHGRGTTVRLLKVTGDTVATFYSGGFKSPPGMRPGGEFGIILKDSWEVPNSIDLSEGTIIQLLHAKGVQGAIWCLDEKPVVVPDAPRVPMQYQPPFLDNTLYIRSRIGLRQLVPTRQAKSAWYKNRRKEEELEAARAPPPQPRSSTKPKVLQKVAITRQLATGNHTFGSPATTHVSLPSPVTPTSSTASPSTVLPIHSKKSKKSKGKEKQSPTSPLSSHATSTSTAPPLAGWTSPFTPSSPDIVDHLDSRGPPAVVLEDEKDRPYAMRCHVRSHLYPVGTPMYWFRNILELLCVFLDLLRTHQQACTSKAGELPIQILHRDCSLWNGMMVDQKRSDWPANRQWSIKKLRELWSNLPAHLQDMRRGLLIDWGFAAVEHHDEVGAPPERRQLTAEELQVYKSTEFPFHPFDAVNDEDDVERHGIQVPEDFPITHAVPPLWTLIEDSEDGDGKLKFNTQTFVRAARNGGVNHNWVNELLKKIEDSGGQSSATGTWPFVSLDVMVAWLMGQSLVIQPHHDLETFFFSFTAICMWFDTPFHAKNIKEHSPMAWIFKPQDPEDNNAVRAKWEMFRPDFERMIIGNLSPYFACDAVKNLLIAMRDMCIPEHWGNLNEAEPSGYLGEGYDYDRVAHDDMIKAVETAILTLLEQENPDDDRLVLYTPSPQWLAAHAKIDGNGIFKPPMGMDEKLPPVVLDSIASSQVPVPTTGVFHLIHHIKPEGQGDTDSSTRARTSTKVATADLVEYEKQQGGAVKKARQFDDSALDYFIPKLKGDKRQRFQ